MPDVKPKRLSDKLRRIKDEETRPALREWMIADVLLLEAELAEAKRDTERLDDVIRRATAPLDGRSCLSFMKGEG